MEAINKIEVNRSWWYKPLRAISLFCYKYWWLVWLLFILFLILWFLFCFRTPKYTCEIDQQINDRIALISSNVDSCCDCKANYISKIISPPLNVKPCDYDESKSGGQGIETNYHSLGENPGMVNIAYNMEGIPDRLDVYYDDNLVASTNSYVSGRGVLSFYYPAENGRPDFCKIVLRAPKNGTVWSYHIGCPR